MIKPPIRMIKPIRNVLMRDRGELKSVEMSAAELLEFAKLCLSSERPAFGNADVKLDEMAKRCVMQYFAGGKHDD